MSWFKKKERGITIKGEYVICAAIHYDDGKKHIHQPKNIKTGLVICGRRHHNCMAIRKICSGKETLGENIQGFLTSENRFIDKDEAADVALESGQIERTHTLFSEDLY